MLYTEENFEDDQIKLCHKKLSDLEDKSFYSDPEKSKDSNFESETNELNTQTTHSSRKIKSSWNVWIVQAKIQLSFSDPKYTREGIFRKRVKILQVDICQTQKGTRHARKLSWPPRKKLLSVQQLVMSSLTRRRQYQK